MATITRVGLDHYTTQIQKNPNFDFNRKHLREDARKSRDDRNSESKQESFQEVLARVNAKRN